MCRGIGPQGSREDGGCPGSTAKEQEGKATKALGHGP